MLLGESRVAVWVIAQQHLYWAAFVLGTFFLVTILEISALFCARHPGMAIYDRLARECLDLVMLAVAVAALLGGLLPFALLALYPNLIAYLTSVFRPAFFGVWGPYSRFHSLRLLLLHRLAMDECRRGEMAPREHRYPGECDRDTPLIAWQCLEQFYGVSCWC